MNNQLIKELAQRQTLLSQAIKKGSGGKAAANLHKYAWLESKDAGTLRTGSLEPLQGINEDEHSATFVVTTINEDRDGDVVVPQGISLVNYSKSPVFFFGHQENPIPIGVARDPQGRITVKLEEKRAVAKFFFDMADPDAAFLFGKVQRGILSATSIAFVPLQAKRREPREEKAQHDRDDVQPSGWLFSRVDLTEISLVGVPANAEALRDAWDAEKSFLSPRMQKGLVPYLARAKGRCFSGWCPCPQAKQAVNVAADPDVKTFRCLNCGTESTVRTDASPGTITRSNCWKCGGVTRQMVEERKSLRKGVFIKRQEWVAPLREGGGSSMFDVRQRPDGRFDLIDSDHQHTFDAAGYATEADAWAVLGQMGWRRFGRKDYRTGDRVILTDGRKGTVQDTQSSGKNLLRVRLDDGRVVQVSGLFVSPEKGKAMKKPVAKKPDCSCHAKGKKAINESSGTAGGYTVPPGTKDEDDEVSVIQSGGGFIVVDSNGRQYAGPFGTRAEAEAKARAMNGKSKSTKPTSKQETTMAAKKIKGKPAKKTRKEDKPEDEEVKDETEEAPAEEVEPVEKEELVPSASATMLADTHKAFGKIKESLCGDQYKALDHPGVKEALDEGGELHGHIDNAMKCVKDLFDEHHPDKDMEEYATKDVAPDAPGMGMDPGDGEAELVQEAGADDEVVETKDDPDVEEMAEGDEGIDADEATEEIIERYTQPGVAGKSVKPGKRAKSVTKAGDCMKDASEYMMDLADDAGIPKRHKSGLKFHAAALDAACKDMTPDDMGVQETMDLPMEDVQMAEEDDVTKENRTCAVCGKSGPVADDETDPDPDDNDLILDSRGLVYANHYVCGRCLKKGHRKDDPADEEEKGGEVLTGGGKNGSKGKALVKTKVENGKPDPTFDNAINRISDLIWKQTGKRV